MVILGQWVLPKGTQGRATGVLTMFLLLDLSAGADPFVKIQQAIYLSYAYFSEYIQFN